MAGSILGNRVARTEDPELLTEGGTYVADLDLPGKVHAVFVRSPFAHADLTGIDVAEAATAPGVVAVHTGESIGLDAGHGFVKVDDAFARYPLAVGKVRFVGEAVAVVVAETLEAAQDAAELVFVDYEPLPAVVDPERALDADVVLFDAKPDNIAISDTDTDADVLAGADVVVRGRYVNQRLAAVPIEPNSAAASVGEDGRVTVWAATQMPHLLQRQLAGATGMDRADIRVIAPHVGGGFGAKAGLYPEQVVVLTLTRLIGRPVTWTEQRSENMVALAHSRGQIQYVELGLTTEGDITGMRVRLVGDAGAYPNVGAFLPAGTKRMSNATYGFPGIRFDIVVPVTNTTPMGAYRGAGRPEAAALVERAVDHAALELGIDPLEIRRRNFLTPDQFPFSTISGITYDSGEYERALDLAAEHVGYDELRMQQAARLAAGERTVLGIGVASYVEVTSGGGGSEFGAVEVHEDGSATITAGTSAHGQGHQTSYAMIVAEETGIPVERIQLVQSDTDRVRSGGGTGGSRSLQLAGSAVSEATAALITKARNVAAHLLEAAVDDIVVDTETASLSVAGVPAKAVTWGDLAAAAAAGLPADVLDTSDDAVGLAAQLDFQQDDGTFPFGTHIAVVEVDLDTGKVAMVRHVGVDDAGVIVNPLIFEGQQQGGIAQGAAQALFEEVVYDDDGNPLTANLMNYTVPSAAEMISFDALHTQTPTPLNPLGAKGIGEAATVGSTPAVQNAVIDALKHLGVRHMDMPCTPERVWDTIRAAEAGTLADPWREPPSVFDTIAADQEADEAGVAAAESI